MDSPRDLCVKPARGPLVGAPTQPATPSPTSSEVKPMQAQIGKEAPDFEANGFLGEGFRPFKLSDYRGRWVVLCFYPGDFTFV